MSEYNNDRFDKEELMAFLENIDHGGFEKLTLTYLPGLQQFQLNPEFDDNGYNNVYKRFVNDLLNSKYAEFINY